MIHLPEKVLITEDEDRLENFYFDRPKYLQLFVVMYIVLTDKRNTWCADDSVYLILGIINYCWNEQNNTNDK